MFRRILKGERVLLIVVIDPHVSVWISPLINKKSIESSMLGPRAVLSAPTTAEDERILSIVILIVSVFSVVGAAWVIASFTVFSSGLSNYEIVMGTDTD